MKECYHHQKCVSLKLLTSSFNTLQTECIAFWECFDDWRQWKPSRWIKKRGKYVVHKRIYTCFISSPWHCYKNRLQLIMFSKHETYRNPRSTKNDISSSSFKIYFIHYHVFTSRIFLDTAFSQKYVFMYDIKISINLTKKCIFVAKMGNNVPWYFDISYYQHLMTLMRKLWYKNLLQFISLIWLLLPHVVIQIYAYFSIFAYTYVQTIDRSYYYTYSKN